jgi:hypothetical protein
MKFLIFGLLCFFIGGMLGFLPGAIFVLAVVALMQ